jgi:hypothetical protein
MILEFLKFDVSYGGGLLPSTKSVHDKLLVNVSFNL